MPASTLLAAAESFWGHTGRPAVHVIRLQRILNVAKRKKKASEVRKRDLAESQERGWSWEEFHCSNDQHLLRRQEQEECEAFVLSASFCDKRFTLCYEPISVTVKLHASLQ